MRMAINRVVPALLTDSPTELSCMLLQAATFTDWVQIDIMDGLFVPSTSVTNRDIADADPRIGWEAHLMVKEPLKYIEDFYAAGAKRIIIHYESVEGDAARVISNITYMGMGAGLALNPETPASVIDKNTLRCLDSVLFLAVHPGYYGAKFVPEVIAKIRSFKRLFPEINIAIDGGVKADNITQVAQAGANEICVGSAIFSQPEPAAAYTELNRRAQVGWSNS
jgi:ribulose-phosphate 3-epimerase